MKILITIVLAFYFCIGSSETKIFSQSREKSKARRASVTTEKKRTEEKKGDSVDYSSGKEIRPSFRYVIVNNDLQFDDDEEKVPVRRFVTVLMDERAFTEANLIYLFKYLANYYTDPLYLGIDVHTSLMTLETLEESVALSTHSNRDDFRQFHKTASYGRSNDIYERCSAGFLYDTGKPGNFVMKHVNLTCTTKK